MTDLAKASVRDAVGKRIGLSLTISALIGAILAATGQWGITRLYDSLVDATSAPLRLSIMREGSNSTDVVIPQEPRFLYGTKVSFEGSTQWASDLGGSVGSPPVIAVVAHSDRPVIITSVSLQTMSCTGFGSRWTGITKGGTGGEVTNLSMGFEVDKPGPGQVLGDWSFPRWVASSEVEVFELTVFPSKQPRMCDFVFIFHYIDEGKPRTSRLASGSRRGGFRAADAALAPNQMKWGNDTTSDDGVLYHSPRYE